MSDITLQNFEAELIQASMQQPVLLDIWAPWCGPCRTLGPILEKLEVAYGGRFKLAKLNSDDQPEIAGQLSQAFGVRSIPFCVLFHQGQPVDGFVGALPEAQVRAFLDRHVPSAEEVEAEQDAAEAEALRELIERHAELTGSTHARRILDAWPTQLPKFVRVIPKDYKRVLACLKRAHDQGLSGDEATMAAFEENSRDLSRVGGN